MIPYLKITVILAANITSEREREIFELQSFKNEEDKLEKSIEKSINVLHESLKDTLTIIGSNFD